MLEDAGVAQLLEGGEAQEEGIVCNGKDHERNIYSRSAKKSSGCNRGQGERDEVRL